MPEKSLVSEITHVALAFMSPATFNQVEPSSWPLFTTVETARSQFSRGTAIMVAIGGWGDTEGFEVAAATEGGRKLFARNVKSMVEATGADGKPTMRTPRVWISNASIRRGCRLGIPRVGNDSCHQFSTSGEFTHH